MMIRRACVKPSPPYNYFLPYLALVTGLHCSVSSIMSGAPTYESTLKHHGLTEEQMQVECSDGVILALVQKTIGWRNIAPYLDVDDSVVDAVVNEPTTDDEGKCRKFLERWKEKFGHVATLERLARCFISSGKATLADLVCEERKKTLPPSAGKCTASTVDAPPFALHASFPCACYTGGAVL